MKTRREFLSTAGFGAAALAQAAAQQIGAPAPASTRKIRLAVVGGGFGAGFHWAEHPNCVVSAVTDLYAVRRQKLREAYRCDSAYDSLEDMLKKRNDLDAVAIFSGAPDHAKHVVMCMERGLHVVSPAGFILATGSTRWRAGAVAIPMSPPAALPIVLHEMLAMTGYCCPATGALLSLDIHEKGAAPDDDIVLDLDALADAPKHGSKRAPGAKR